MRRIKNKFYFSSSDYTWKRFEKAKGIYDFSEIEEDLVFLQSKGKKVVYTSTRCNFRWQNYLRLDFIFCSTKESIYSNKVLPLLLLKDKNK